MDPVAFDPAGIIGTAVTSLEGVLTGVAGPAIGLGAAVLGLMFGWSLVQRFIH